MLKPGDIAPDFVLKDAEGRDVRLWLHEGGHRFYGAGKGV